MCNVERRKMRRETAEHTLPHEILKMVPLHIVGEIANIDPAVLLRGFSDAAHSLFLGSLPFFERPMLWATGITSARSSTRCSNCAHRTALAAVILAAVSS